jgi:hypothetical protein
MALWSQFCSGSYASRSPTYDCEQTINRYPITIDSATNAKKVGLAQTPGLTLLLSVDTTSCRGCFYEDHRTFTVVGDTLYEIDIDANTAATLGTIADDGLPVSFASNGRGGEQLAIVGGGELKVFDLMTNTLGSAVTLPLTNAPVQMGFIDGYGLLLEADSVRIWFSALEDFESWDALDFFARSQTSDHFVALAVVRDRIFALGSHTTEVYYDSGDADTPFIPYPGALIREGIVGPWAWAIEGEALYWMAEDVEGRARCVRATDVQAQKISTDAIDFALASYPRLDDVETLSYWQEGHGFVIWTCPTADTCGVTWAWDTKEELWHQRRSWDSVVAGFYRWRVRGICSTPKGLLCGDFETQDLYRLSLDAFTENGQTIRRVRRAPYLSADASWMFLDQLEIGVQTGTGLTTGQGSDPLLMLRLSRDGGRTWTPTLTGRTGPMGAYGTRCVFRRLGRVRGDQLVVEVSDTDPVRSMIGPGVWLRLTQGTRDL